MIYYEYNRFGEEGNYVVKEYDDFHYPFLHFHRNYEFIYLFSGKINASIDGAEYVLQSGEFLLVFPNQIHSFTSLEKARARVCIFSPKLVNEFYQANDNLLPKKTITKLSSSVENFLLENLTKSATRYAVKACLYAVCAEISKNTTFIEQKTPKNFLLAHQLITYISQNYKSTLSLQQIAKDLGYSYPYLSNYLNKYNLRFSDLLHQYRLDYAKHLLKTTDLSITDVAFTCGYNSIRTFNRNFQRRFHTTPQKYKTT